MKSIFLYKDYHAFLKDRYNTSGQEWGAVTKMAEAAQCQRSHLSKVMKGDLHLTMDQACGLSQFWKLDEDEEEYFLLLVEKARAGTVPLRKRIEKKLLLLQQRKEQVSQRLSQPNIASTNDKNFYYTSWTWSAIHVATSVPALQTASAIAARLNLSVELVEQFLLELEKHNLVKREKNRWVHSSGAIHLPANSSMISCHHQNWRTRAVTNSQLNIPSALHYTTVVSMSKDDAKSFQHRLLELIKEFQGTVKQSPEEEIYCWSLDFCKV